MEDKEVHAIYAVSLTASHALELINAQFVTQDISW